MAHPWYPGGLGEEERRREESRRERMEEEYFEDWRAIAPPNQQPRASAPTEASPRPPRSPCTSWAPASAPTPGSSTSSPPSAPPPASGEASLILYQVQCFTTEINLKRH